MFIRVRARALLAPPGRLRVRLSYGLPAIVLRARLLCSGSRSGIEWQSKNFEWIVFSSAHVASRSVNTAPRQLRRLANVDIAGLRRTFRFGIDWHPRNLIAFLIKNSDMPFWIDEGRIERYLNRKDFRPRDRIIIGLEVHSRRIHQSMAVLDIEIVSRHCTYMAVRARGRLLRGTSLRTMQMTVLPLSRPCPNGDFLHLAAFDAFEGPQLEPQTRRPCEGDNHRAAAFRAWPPANHVRSEIQRGFRKGHYN